MILGGLSSYMYLEVRRARIQKQSEALPRSAFLHSAESVANA
jgi:hypothetical protein